MRQFYPELTEKFRIWFEGSKGFDENGKPQVFYHKSRTKDKFEIFEHGLGEKNDYNDCFGFYFVADYHKPHAEYIGLGLGYYVYLSMKNPFYIYDDGKGKDGSIKDQNGKVYFPLDITKQFCQDVQENGFDSIIIICYMYYNQYIVFNSDQIKSVDNNGEYSKEILNIFE